MKTFNFSQKLVAAFFAVLVVLMPELADASTGANNFNVKICKIIVCFLSNSTILMLATIAIIFLGIGAFFGKVNWGLAVTVAIGIILIAGAGQIALIFFDGTPQDCNTLPGVTC